MILSYKIHNVAPYINWIYFFHAWGFQPRFAAIANIHGCDVCRASWLTTFPEEDRNKASEAMQLFKEANRMLDLLDKDYEVRTIFKLCKANSDGDNLVIEKETGQFLVFPLLRQQTPKRDGSPFLCLSDFIRRTAGYETDRHHTDREWCHVPSCFGLRSDVCPSGCRILLCRKDRRRPARRLCPPSGKKYGGNAKIPGCQSAITFVYL